MLDALDCLADERLDQERLGIVGRNAARFEVEQEVFVERPRGSTVAALDIVSENLELRLVVRLGRVRKQQGVGSHFGVGFLGVRADDDLALENAASFIIEHGLEYLPADAVVNGMIGNQRGVGMLAAPEQARAPDACDRTLAIEAHEQLIAHDAGAGREQKFVETRMRADRRHQGRDMQCPRALAGYLDVVDMSPVADLELERCVHLILAAGRTVMGFDQHRAGTRLDPHKGTYEDRSRLAAGIDEHEVDRPRQRYFRGNMDHRTITHEGSVERDRDVATRHHLAEMLHQLGIPDRQGLRHRTDGETGFEVGQVGQFRYECTVDEHD